MRKFVRQETLATMVKEKYLPYIPPEKKEEPQKTPQEIRKEKWENFWFYYKKPIIIGIIVLIFVVLTFEPWRTRENPDYKIYLASPYFWNDSNLDTLEDSLEFFGEDLNGDGEVCIQITGYMIDQSVTDLDATENLQTYMTKLIADISLVDGFIFLLDEPCANWLGYGETLFTSIEEPYAKLPWELGSSAIKLEDFAYNWHNTEVIRNNNTFNKLDLKLFFCLRELSGTALKHAEKCANDQALLTRILNNDPVDSEGYAQWLEEQRAEASSVASK